eukprot:1160652-Pelagomonas_calceolata.AAC.8
MKHAEMRTQMTQCIKSGVQQLLAQKQRSVTFEAPTPSPCCCPCCCCCSGAASAALPPGGCSTPPICGCAGGAGGCTGGAGGTAGDGSKSDSEL